MRTKDFYYTGPEGRPTVDLSDVRSLLLDLAIAQENDEDVGPMYLLAESGIRVARAVGLAEIGLPGDADNELLCRIVSAASALQAAQREYGRALADLESWKEGEGFV